MLPLANKHNVKILPADSEHSAIFQVSIYDFGDCHTNTGDTNVQEIVRQQLGAL